MKGDNSQLLPKIIEGIFGQRFGKDVSYLFLCIHIFQFHLLFINLFSKEMILDRYMFGLGVQNQILRYADGTRIVTVDWYRLIVFDLNFF